MSTWYRITKPTCVFAGSSIVNVWPGDRISQEEDGRVLLWEGTESVEVRSIHPESAIRLGLLERENPRLILD